MKNKETIYIVASVLILLALAGGAYWYFLMAPVVAPQTSTNNSASNTGTNGFKPFDRPGTNGTGNTTNPSTGTNASGATATSSANTSISQLATLRLLSSTPVGGYGASTTARTTVVRWVDRGRGNIYEAKYDSSTVTTISNTVVPRIYESSWNRNLTSFIGSIYQDNSSTWMAVNSQLVAQSVSTSTDSQVTPFALRGKKLPAGVIGYATSPRKDKLFMLTNEGGNSIGYTSNLDGTGVTQIFTTPLTQVNVSWPSDNIITIATKGSASYSGFLYFVNPKTGVWTKVLGPIPGLSTSFSHDGKYVLWSGTGNSNNVVTGIYNVSKKTNSEAGIATLADKCAWGNFYTAVVYCAVPSSLASATYPDDWYQGKVSHADKIWQVDASSGIVKLVSSVVDQSDRVIDGFKLDLDSKDSYLFFMNKNDLSLWSLDLVAAR